MYQKAQAENWPAREAIITKTYISRHMGRVKGGFVRYSKPEICGNYKDTNEFFCVDRIRYGGFRFGEGHDEALSALKKYPVAMEVDVYYDPDNPDETVLE